jgi:hypothetical protein
MIFLIVSMFFEERYMRRLCLLTSGTLDRLLHNV